MTSPRVRPRQRAAAGLLGVVLLTGTAGCVSGADDPQPSPSPVPGASTGTAPTLDAKPVPMAVRVTRVSGRLTRSGRAPLERSIGRTIGGYWDAAYLGGRYPRGDFGTAFAGFTGGAEQRARHDRGFLTNSGLGRSTDNVAPKEKSAWLSVLAPNGVAAGVSARVRLVYVAERDRWRDQRVTVTGRLLLTRKQSGGWQIFGYDVSRAARPVERGAAR